MSDATETTMTRGLGTWRWLTVFAAAAVVAGAIGVVTAGDASGETSDNGEEAVPEDGWFHDVDYYVARRGGGEGFDDVDDIRDRLLDELEEAETRIDTAISVLDDDEIRDALVAAANRGVAVRVVADELYEDDEAFEPLLAHDDISVEFGDGDLAYLPEPNVSPLLEHCADLDHDDHRTCLQAGEGLSQNNDRIMVRPAHYNVMSHTFFLIDETYVWNITAPLTEDRDLWFAFRAMSEEMTNSFEREFRQMHGGVFATTLSVYNGPLKSLTHQEPLRLTNRGQLRVRFNPQERLMKNIVDETYRARASVYVMTENLTNEDLIAALEYKKENDFDVRVLVGQGQAEAPVVEEAIEPLDPVVAPEELGELPSMVIIDSERDRRGNRQPRTVQILSHEMWRAQPFELIVDSESDLPSDQVRFYPSDTFADGVMWELVESGIGEENMNNPELDPFVDAFEQKWGAANGQ